MVDSKCINATHLEAKALANGFRDITFVRTVHMMDGAPVDPSCEYTGMRLYTRDDLGLQAFFDVGSVASGVPLVGGTKCPWGWEGCTVAIRETWADVTNRTSGIKITSGNVIAYKSDGDFRSFGTGDLEIRGGGITSAAGVRWKSAACMPRRFVRYTATVVCVDVMHVQDLWYGHALLSGFQHLRTDEQQTDSAHREYVRQQFAAEWDKQHRGSVCKYGANPWVWVVACKVGDTGCEAGWRLGVL